MDVPVMQSPVGDCSKKREKSRWRRERKKQAKSEARNKLHMHDKLEAPERTSDCKLDNDNSESILLETDLAMKPLSGNPKMGAGSTETLLEGNMENERKERRKKSNSNKAIVEEEAQSIGQTNADVGSTENPVEGNVTGKRKRKRKKTKKAVIQDEAHEMGQIQTNGGSMENPVQGNVTRKRKNRRKKIKTEDIKAVTTHISSSDVKDVECLCPEKALMSSVRRKLLILDVNGILVDIVQATGKQRKGDTRLPGREVYRRPFCGDFLKFCFQNFDVGVWSSRSKRLLHQLVDFLLGNLKHKLLFCWDMSHSTQTGFRTLDYCQKPLVCKELSKIWDNDDPNMHWKKGDYNESNTLLLDDSPYKALLNPMHTAVFPYPYSVVDKNDNSLGPRGDLRVYLEGLLTSDNVQMYVEQHPFGQKAIDDQNPSWGFYAGVLNRMSYRLK
ncbi:hypothetical protein OROGR_018258 [Orobanche gracilis]